MSELVWVAIYSEDDVLKQHGDDGTENKYSDIDRDKLTEFAIVDRDTDAPVFIMTLEEGDRLIYRRRNSLDGVTGERDWVITLVGWQRLVHGKNIQSLNWIFPDGTIVNTGKFNPNHRIFYATDLYPWEEHPEQPE